MRLDRRQIWLAILLSASQLLAGLPATEAGNPFQRSKSPLEKLAKTIDHLEKEIDLYGTLNAKSPDIWGEARLTKHRQEFERQLAARLTDFEIGYNAAIARSDQAFLSQTLALSAMLSGGVGGTAAPPATINSTVVQNPATPAESKATVNSNGSVSVSDTAVIYSTQPFSLLSSADGVDLSPDGNIQLEPTIQLDQRKRFLDHLHQLRRINEGDDTADSPGYSLNLVRIPISLLPGDRTRIGYGGEITITARPHITEELLPKTWRTLVINDLVDQLSLPIVKVAEAKAWLPSEEQKRCIEMIQKYADSLRKEVGDLKENVSSIRTSLKKASEDQSQQTAFNLDEKIAQSFQQWSNSKECLSAIEASSALCGDSLTQDFVKKFNIVNSDARSNGNKIVIALRSVREAIESEIAKNTEMQQEIVAARSFFQAQYRVDIESTQKSSVDSSIVRATTTAAKNLPTTEVIDGLEEAVDTLVTIADQIQLLPSQSVNLLVGAQFPSTSARSRTARYAVPPSRIANIFGEPELLEISRRLYELSDRNCESDDIHLSDAQGFLNEELQAAYDYLSGTEGLNHWGLILQILESVRNGGDVSVLRQSVTRLSASGCPPLTTSELPPLPMLQVPSALETTPVSYQAEMLASVPPAETTPACPPTDSAAVTRALAWAILVESALLDDRLNTDLVRVSQDPGCGCQAAGPYCFYGPNPPIEARHAFMEYVRCRWPIHVFALDPVTQEQNVADVFALRRELQISVAVALQGGKANINSLTRYMRRIEKDMQTVALNQTVVGFAHGPDTFGWRFYPRIQTPDFESKSEAFWRNAFAGPRNRDDDLRLHRIEPGMRECVAIVVMPSFIDHLTFETRSNWFQLAPNKPLSPMFPLRSDTGVAMKEVAKWSRQLQELDDLVMACGLEDPRYQPDLGGRMLARVDQLKKEIPLQELNARVPNENTFGGFEMFSSGVTDLSPQLIGYYGEPGIDPRRETVMFLVGRHFSVHETSVVAGNKPVPFDLLSREVMRVVIPAGVAVTECDPVSPTGDCPECKPATGKKDPVVDVHLATPYGVTSHLRIPVVKQLQAPAPAFNWAVPTIPVIYRYQESSDTKVVAIDTAGIRVARPFELVLSGPENLVNPPTTATVALSLVTGGDSEQVPAGMILNSAQAVGAVSANATYDKVRGVYIISGKDYLDLHVAIKGSVVDLLNGSMKGKAGTVSPLRIRAIGNIQFSATHAMPIEYPLDVVVALEKLN